MKFYFIASVEGNKESYQVIFNFLKELGCQSVTDDILTRTQEQIDRETSKESAEYIQRRDRWIGQADFVVLDFTYQEISIGYEMMIALDKGKPAIILYEKNIGRIPPGLKGINDERIQIYEYEKDNLAQLKQTLKIALEEVKEQVTTRFTLLLPPRIISFLDELSRNKKIPRSVFIRSLIQREMKANDYDIIVN